VSLARIWAAAAVMALAAAAGCGTGSATEVPAAPTGSWRLASGTVDGGRIETFATHRITLVLEGERVGGSAACNSYGGPVGIDGDQFEARDLAVTEMACEPPVMAAEAAYLDALGRVDTIRREDGRLVLAGPSIELRFDPLAPVPTSQLLDTPWELDTVIRGDVASSVPGPAATLRIGSDGSLAGETGCRSFRGRYVLRGDEIHVTELAVDGAATAGVCTDEGVEQDRVVLEVLGDGFRAQVEGDRLTLTSAGPDALVYRAA